jgi:WD40 repeat protein
MPLWSLGLVLLASVISCTQPSAIPESSDLSAPPVVTTGTPSQAPIVRIETEMHTARISSISADEAGRYLVTASDDKTLRVWELSTGRLLRVLRPPIGQGNEGKMYAAAISPDGETVAGTGWSGLEWDGAHSIYIFDRASGRMLRRISGLPQSIPHLAFSPDGRVLLATSHGKQGIRFYGTVDGRLLAEDRDYRAETYGASFDKRGRVVTASYDGSLRLYGRDFRLLAQAQVPEGKRPFTISLIPNGSKIAVGYENSAQVDIFSGEDLHYLYSPDMKEAGKGYLNVVSWSIDGEILYAGGQYRQGHTHLIRKWITQGQGQWTDLPASSNTILRIVPLTTGGIAYGAADPAFGVFDTRDARRLFKGPDTLDYRDTHDTFLLSPDGTTVQFNYRKEQAASSRFSIGDRLLQQNPAPLSTLRPPRTAAAGLVIEQWKNFDAPTLNGRPLRLKPYEVSRCLALAPDNQTALLGTVWYLRLFDSRGREVWQIPAPANVWSVNIAENGLVAAAALADGTIRWYRMADGQELLALFPQPESKRWVAWTPSGYYDAGPGSEAILGWHKNYGRDAAADFFPAAQFRAVSYRPGIVKTVLETFDEQQAVLRNSSGEAATLAAQPDIHPTDRQPLVVISPHDGAAVSSTTVRIRYRMHPTAEADAEKISVLVDGKTGPEARGVKVMPSPAAAKIYELDVQIPERDCEVSLVLATQSGSKSAPVTVRLKWKPVFAVKPMLYALAVGVSSLQALSNLAAKDAKDFAATLQQQEGSLYRGVITKVLTESEATKDAIIDGLDWLDRETTSKDVAMLFIKGQVVADRNGTPYLLSAQAKKEHLRLTALPLSDIKNVASGLAGRTVIFTDVCQAHDPQNTDACAAAVMQLGNDLSNSEQGMALFSASTAHYDAQEISTGGNGVLTTALMEGLTGRAALGGAKHISVSMLEIYLSERIKALTQGRQILSVAKSYDLPDFAVASAHGQSQALTPVPSLDEARRKPASQEQEILRRLPPVITILSPQDGATVSSPQVTVRYSVRIPTDEPITEIVGLVDGRPIPTAREVHRGERRSDGTEIREVRLEVPERESEISILARNRWASSEPSTVRVRWHRQDQPIATPPKPTLHALVIGVGQYEDASLKLEFSAKDAVDFAATLKRQQGGLYKTVVTKIITDAEATKANILEGLEWLERETTRHDLAVVFLAGHGVNDKNGLYYFLPVNAKVDQLRRTGLAFSDIKNTVAALSGKTLLFADTCHAGNIFGRRRGTVDINAVVNELTSAENGAVVFASSTGKQESMEDPVWGNGAFTKALVEALNGKAAYGGSKKITINMLDLYLSERVKELTKGQQTPTTTKPLTIQDFPVAIQLDTQ